MLCESNLTCVYIVYSIPTHNTHNNAFYILLLLRSFTLRFVLILIIMSTCGLCKELVTAVPDSVTCYNSACKMIYHARCAGLSRSKLSIILETSNVFWFCNDCCQLPPVAPIVPTENVVPIQLVVNISDKLEGIQESLAKLTDAMAVKAPSWPSVSDSWPPVSDSATITNKRRRVTVSDDEYPPAPKSSAVVIGSADLNDGLKIVEARKLLVASMFHPSTDSVHLTKFLNEKLNLPESSTEVRVHKLVPAGKNLADLDYVSFKISVLGNRADELKLPSMWPKGVRVREFEYRPRKPRSDAVFLPQQTTAATVAVKLTD